MLSRCRKAFYYTNITFSFFRVDAYAKATTTKCEALFTFTFLVYIMAAL